MADRSVFAFLDKGNKNESISQPKNENSFFKYAQQFQGQEQDYSEEPSRLRSIVSAFPKALIKNTANVLSDDSILASMPEYAGAPERKKKFLETIEKVLPTKEGPIEEILETAGHPLNFINSGGFLANLGRSLLGGTLRKGAKELGLPEWAQTVAEIAGHIAPGIGGKKITTVNPKNADILETGRKFGLTEKQLTPLIQSEKKINTLAKYAAKTGRAEKALEDTHKGLDDLFVGIRKTPEAQKIYSNENANKTLSDIIDSMNKLPHEARKLVSKDFHDLINKPLNADSLIDFYRDINYNIKKGNKILGGLLDPIRESFYRASPELGKDFNAINDAYKGFLKINKVLRPSMESGFFDARRSAQLAYGLTMQDPKALGELLGEYVSKKAARELLINPRFQNLQIKMISALNDKKYMIANRAYKEIQKMVKDEED